MKIAKLRNYGGKVGRQGLSLAAQKAVNEYDGSYKGVMELCGKLSVLAKAATSDIYWDEQVDRGVRKQELEVEKVIAKSR
ncbi:hypothetical protein PP590_gp73 [Pseudoalteromonas phage HS1]|uniref:hypothetical protein n=1 Tax=Pseudoalteromonas phage H105/1 TaxID=877240 RepID=UPI0001E439EB|nr:hypothetical protein AV949_gp40 [Pseudoalteromonas phage H105/1]YP_010660152.1 hypothetical protein PP589_gp68 [Pseudoalteromonas phage HS5]YP_010660230.1 hypothetical protein PP590_gp73 [Pseudoalteromonas phage HS1]ADM26700.1 hypothetical protein [Pseudoalteromonas phage H105/1]